MAVVGLLLDGSARAEPAPAVVAQPLRLAAASATASAEETDPRVLRALVLEPRPVEPVAPAAIAAWATSPAGRPGFAPDRADGLRAGRTASSNIGRTTTASLDLAD